MSGITAAVFLHTILEVKRRLYRETRNGIVQLHNKLFNLFIMSQTIYLLGMLRKVHYLIYNSNCFLGRPDRQQVELENHIQEVEPASTAAAAVIQSCLKQDDNQNRRISGANLLPFRTETPHILDISCSTSDH